jgi:hypothetical protein
VPFRAPRASLMLLALAAALSPAAAQANDAPKPAAQKPAGPPNAFYSRLGVAPVGGGFSMEGYWVWGSSVVKGDDGLYHMFVSRWPKRLPFHPGWLVASEIVHATAKTVEGPYKFSEVALPARGPQFWDGRSTHNPKIMRWKDKWVLFYMGSTHPFDEVKDPATLTLDSPYTTIGRSNKRIGVATATSPYGPWTRQDAPVLPTKPGTFYSFLTSNPAPYIEKDGRTILVFKGRSHKTTFPYHGDMSIGVATAPNFLGPYTVKPETLFAVDKHGEVEDPYIWRDKAGFHLIAKDQRGDITGEKHGGLYAHSKDGIDWKLDPSPKAYSKTITWDDGKTITMGQLERAFAFSENGTVTHMFFATMDGPGGFKNGTKTWNMVVRMKPETAAR